MLDGPRVVIVGAGACGLACARRLSELGHDNWVILEASSRVGGLAASTRDSSGFMWELGGHVVFGDSGSFRQLVLDAIPGDELVHHQRSSAIHFDRRFIPYPFQQNIGHLPFAAAIDCLSGLAKVALHGTAVEPANFHERILSTYGTGLARHFFEPYNAKVWCTPLDQLDDGWIADRLAPVNLGQALSKALSRREAKPWGPNREFLFPAQGGIGRIWDSVVSRLGDRIRLGAEIELVDTNAGIAHTADGAAWPYDILVSTIPLDVLVSRLAQCPLEVQTAARRLVHTQVHVVGVGYETPLADPHNWIYFPDRSVPFYRATNMAKYTSSSVPDSDVTRYSGWLTETALPPGEAASSDALSISTDAALRNVGLVPRSARVVSTYSTVLSRAYPVPTLNRDTLLCVIQPWLQSCGIYSRGRMGTWRYEIGNMDHAVQMGTELAALILKDVPEQLFTRGR